MALLLVAGENWVRQSGRSPEWWDSWVIMVWVRLQVLERGHSDLHSCLAGYCEHVHGTSWRRVVSEGYATYVRNGLFPTLSGCSHVTQVYWAWFGGQVVD